MVSTQKERWYRSKELTPEKRVLARRALEDIRDGTEVFAALRRNPLPNGEGFLNKSMLVAVYRDLVEKGEWGADTALMAKIRLKPMRTLSGVTTVTVLTKPYPCPGKCIFCPTDVRMPKSYLPDEPGAMRALHHEFDPFEQADARIQALHAVGHPTDKIELLVLGGTWSSYRADYQEWFLKRCFDAMNGVESESLADAQAINETTEHRNVGLVVETRPDHVDQEEIAWLRSLGVTKLQIGAQSLDDEILDLNNRGHTVQELRDALALLRAAGFKVVLHWMPNLLGATVDSDREDFVRLWDGLCPDELKIYPTQLLANAELYEYWQRGEYTPYETDELIEMIADIKTSIPRYCRVNRVIRDIPSTNVVEGNRRTSLRQDVQLLLEKRGEQCQCVRCREVRGQAIDPENLILDDLIFGADFAEEHFISYVTPDDKLAGFLRLSLPTPEAPNTGLVDLKGAAIIREVHVYGQSLQFGQERQGAAQHIGLGTTLMQRAEEIAKEKGFQSLAVISAIGTRRYYLERGFERGELYLVKKL
ncbi:MAG: tRNA uridine(34) 5-carboxymethylaminomethyl modification radical SAM/GNAT enzyme Elp3 [Anaerolineales bacterium]|nr:tRNA uridine(34) 5-carboxymethylaminomethyl modification radical SAM/GNAT enzyme Elp3 [Chloroflexota bacterium]MBL6981077.1 tRNA uridine(34) 5-carboxymethylaminomethyl modification radical SAM/GNAT enzyme Elp3 [Anaerolineales bacterium]